MKVAAIDPGVNGCGFALFDGVQFVCARYITGRGGQAHPLLESLDGIERFLAELALAYGEEKPVETLVIEVPQVYEARFQKGDQFDLIRLAICAGAIAGGVRPFVKSVLFVQPKEWKGNTPKDVTEHRVLKHLSKEEQDAIELPRAQSLHNNVFDAVGIGMWRVGR